MVNKKILKIRKKLDNLDDLFLNLIRKRTILVDQVLSNKKYKKDIIDRKIIKVILVHKKSKNKIDLKITKKIWKSMIYAYIDYEFRNFKKIIIYCVEVIFFQ